MAYTVTLLSSRWLIAPHCTRGAVLTLQTAVHVIRPCSYAATTVDALRSTTPILSALFGRSVCSHHILARSFSFSLIDAAPPELWFTKEGLVLPTSNHLVAALRQVARLDESVFTLTTAQCPLAASHSASVSLFDPKWRINCSRLMPSGPHGGITTGTLETFVFSPPFRQPVSVS